MLLEVGKKLPIFLHSSLCSVSRRFCERIYCYSLLYSLFFSLARKRFPAKRGHVHSCDDKKLTNVPALRCLKRTDSCFLIGLCKPHYYLPHGQKILRMSTKTNYLPHHEAVPTLLSLIICTALPKMSKEPSSSKWLITYFYKELTGKQVPYRIVLFIRCQQPKSESTN